MPGSTNKSNDVSPARRPAGRKSKDRTRKTLGPLDDLENHLPPDWWKTLFNAVYLKTDGDVVENLESTQRDVDTVLKLCDIGKDARILDCCCGQGRHSIELAHRGFTDITGLDRSRYLIRLAKRRSRKLGLKISFHEGDVRKFRFKDDAFDLVTLLGNSFGYFDHEDDDLQVLRNAFRILKPGARLLLDITDGEWMKLNFLPRSWEWIDQEQMVNRERSLSSDGTRVISRELVMHSEKGVLADQLYAERLYSRVEIQALLEKAGFEEVGIYSDLETVSSRNEDLGMMSQRIIVTCRTPLTKIVPAAPTQTLNITVLLGDPRKADAVKLGGRFNSEDVETVERLKTALAGIDGIEATYLDDHTSMLEQIRDAKPDLVFNLCDEGFDNDPLRELHVPAFLELLNLRYTGSAPTTLGMCYHKSFVRTLADSFGVPVPMETVIDSSDKSVRLPTVFPVILKPESGDGSIGIDKDSVVNTPGELVASFERLRQMLPDRAILVQEFLTGPEFAVTVIGNPESGYEVLPILTVDFSGLPDDLPKILGYESKWDPESAYWTKIKYRQADDLPEETRRKLGDYSMILFERLGCRDYGRFDFRADAAGEVKLLEVNPNPGWCWDGKVNLMAEMAGYSYTGFLDRILTVAMNRHRIRRQASKS